MNNYQGKRLYMTILTIITVCSIIFGTLYHIGGLFGSAWSWFGLSRLDSRIGGSGDTVTFDETYSGIDSIEIDCMRMSLNITEGSELSVSYKATERWAPTINVEGGHLVIHQKTDTQKQRSQNVWDDLDLTVTIPRGGVDMVSVDVNLGELSLSGFTADTLYVNADMGDVDIDDISGSDISIYANMGDIGISGIDCVNFTVDADMGNIEGDDIKAESISIEANMGNAELDDADFKTLTASVDAGNAAVTSSRDLSDYDIRLSADLGSVTYCGNSQGSHYSQSGSTGSAAIKASMGSVSLSY